MSALAVAWLAIEISSPAQRGLAVGAAIAAYTLPGAAGVFLRPILGRLDPSRLLLFHCGLRAMCLGAVVLLAWTGELAIGAYVALLAGSAVLVSWNSAARYTLVAETLDEPLRLSGNALLEMLLNAGLIAGPAAAGLITASTGATTVLAIDAVTWLVYGACVALARPSSSQGSELAPEAGTQSGFRMILGNPVLLGFLLLTLAFYLSTDPSRSPYRSS